MMKERVTEDKGKRTKKKLNKYTYDKNKLEYISFLCEEDDINFFCTFSEECKSRTDHNSLNKNLYKCRDNIKYGNINEHNLKYSIYEDTYLTVLVHNENIASDERSCSSIAYIYEQFYLNYCDIFYTDYKRNTQNFVKNYEEDINFFHLISKKKKKKKKKKGGIGTAGEGAELYNITGTNNTRFLSCYKTPLDPYVRTGKDINVLHEPCDIIISPYIAYSKLQSCILEYYIPTIKCGITPCYLSKHLKNEKKKENNLYDCNICNVIINRKDVTRGSKYSTTHTSDGYKKKKIKKKNKINNRIIITPQVKREKKDTTGRQSKENIKQRRNKKKRKNEQFFTSHDPLFRLYNYTSSDESTMCFSKFLPEQQGTKKKNKLGILTSRANVTKGEEENNGMVIFNDIIELCKQNKIFTLKDKQKGLLHVCKNEFKCVREKKTLQKSVREEYSTEQLKHHNTVSTAREMPPEKFNKSSIARNLSSCSYINSGCYEHPSGSHLTKYAQKIGNNDNVQRMYKKRSFSTCSSSCAPKVDKVEAISQMNKMCKISLFRNENVSGMREGIINKDKREEKAEVKIEEKTEEKIEKTSEINIGNIQIINNANVKRRRENDLLKKQILIGLNQKYYNPLHLEKIVSSRNCALGKGKIISKEKKKNLDIKRNKKKNEIILNDINSTVSLKNSTFLKHKFCSLYMHGKYTLICQLYRYDYIYIDFHITYIYIKSLIKLKKYKSCLKYIYDINEKNLNIFNRRILHFFCGICYEKLHHFKLSSMEYSKVVVNQMDDNKTKASTNLIPMCELHKEYKTNVDEIKPFVLSCLDKLIGCYQVKTHEEYNLVNYVQQNYYFGKLINYYLCKLSDKKNKGTYNIMEYQNTQNEISFRKVPLFFGDNKNCSRKSSFFYGDNKNYMNMVRKIQPYNSSTKMIDGFYKVSFSDRASEHNYRNGHFNNNITNENNKKNITPIFYNKIINEEGVLNRRTLENLSTIHHYRDKNKMGEKILNVQKINRNYDRSCENRKSNEIFGNQKKDTQKCQYKKCSNLIQKKNMYINMSNILHVTNSDGEASNSEEYFPLHSFNFAHAGYNFAHAGYNFAHAGYNFAHAGYNFAHAGYNFAHAGYNFAHAGYNFAHAGYNFAHAGYNFAHDNCSMFLNEIANSDGKNLKKKFLSLFDKITESDLMHFTVLSSHYDDLYFYALYIFFHICCNKTFKKIANFVRWNFSNENILNMIRKLAYHLKLVDIHFNNTDKVRSRYCIRITTDRGKREADELPRCSGKIYIDKITLIDLICINLYTIKNCDFVNSYYISKYIMKREMAYTNKEAILLFITSLTNLQDFLKNKKNKIKELVLLFHERVNEHVRKYKRYYFKPDMYIYKKDYLDYYILGIISFLNNDMRKSCSFFKKCIQLKNNFYLSYVYLLQISLTDDTLLLISLRERKLIFFECLKLKEYNLLPYLIYCSSVIKKMQQDLHNEKLKKKKKFIYHSTDYLKDMFTRAIYLDGEHIFIYNELFVYNFLRRGFLQCQTIINKVFLSYNFFSHTSTIVTTPLSFILYNAGVYYYLCEKNLSKSEKLVIRILQANPFDIKSLNLLTHILFTKKNKQWLYFFDYCMYLENVLHSKNIIPYKTYVCKNFFTKIKGLRDMNIFIRYYKILKNVEKFYGILENYIKTSNSSLYPDFSEGYA
ncbi:hypothetical protein MKS88_002771 [Plasmodium brasilianum]|uniref:Uncharacterized protein n=1 Tax=Plasmodium brasilianum TaxID=5824 RepID=A0ACB9Y9X3_PLABR|nr:hypothetical protein MKS88_002771 [Plasmodium brasilianum]